MDKRIFVSIIVKYWYLTEFLEQGDFPGQSRENRELCEKAARGEVQSKQITLYHELPVWVDPLVGAKEMADPDLYAELQRDTEKYSRFGVLSDEIHICMGKIERFYLAERLQQIFRQDLEFPEKNHRSICLIGLKCDEYGKYIPNSFALSPLAWGIFQFMKHSHELTRENMANFLSINEYKSCISVFESMLTERVDEETVGRLLTSELLDLVTEESEKQYFSHIIQSD